MFRNQYDNDVTVFSPQGRLFQLEYALEAVKQGAPCVGLTSSTHAVLAGLKRSPSDLSASATRKLLPIAPHIGCAIAGLTSDARILTRAMQREAQAMLVGEERAVPVRRLVNGVGSDRAQRATQYYGGRPFGVGMLVAGCDDTGPHLLEFSPAAGSCLEYWGWAIGARSQSARTFFERHLPEDCDSGDEGNPFANCSEAELVNIAVCALRECLPPDQSLSIANTAVGVVSIGTNFCTLTDDQVGQYLSQLPPRSTSSGDGGGNGDNGNDAGNGRSSNDDGSEANTEGSAVVVSEEMRD